MVKSVFPAVNFLIIKTISTEVAFFYWGLGGQGGKEKVINHYNKQRNSTSSFSSLKKKNKKKKIINFAQESRTCSVAFTSMVTLYNRYAQASFFGGGSAKFG